MDQARKYMEHLFALTDSVALLDMLAGFADLVALSPHVYTRPRLLAASTTGISMTGGQQQDSAGGGNGPPPDMHAGSLVIKTGRHAIISTFKQVSCKHLHPTTHTQPNLPLPP